MGTKSDDADLEEELRVIIETVTQQNQELRKERERVQRHTAAA